MKAIGSEKIQDIDEKLQRIIEMAGIQKNSIINNEKPFGTTSSILHEAVASNGIEYAIIQEEKYIYLKTKENGRYEYMGGVQNIHEHSYSSYANALKHLNLMFKEINEMSGQKENIDIFKKKI